MKPLCNGLHFRTSSLGWCVCKALLKRADGNKRDPTMSDVPQTWLSPPTAWLISAKRGQVLCPGSSTVSGHGVGAKPRLPRSTGRWLHSSWWQALEDVELGQLGLAKASAQAEARAYPVEHDQVKGFSYLSSWEVASAPCLHSEDN